MYLLFLIASGLKIRALAISLCDEAAALDAVEGVAPGGALLHAVGVHPRAAHPEQRLVLKVAPKLIFKIFKVLGLI